MAQVDEPVRFTQWVDKEGYPTQFFYQFCLDIWRKTGASDTLNSANTEEIQDVVGAMVSGNTETAITVTYQDSDGTLDFVITTSDINGLSITTVGTIDTGVWQGTAINQTYLVGQSGTNTGDETLSSVNTLLSSGLITKSVTNSITAGDTQTQAGATALTTDINRVTVSGMDGDGVKLPTAVGGQEILIINDDAAQTIDIWPNTDDSIDGGAADAVDSNSLAAGASRRYIDVDATNWYTA